MPFIYSATYTVLPGGVSYPGEIKTNMIRVRELNDIMKAGFPVIVLQIYRNSNMVSPAIIASYATQIHYQGNSRPVSVVMNWYWPADPENEDEDDSSGGIYLTVVSVRENIDIFLFHDSSEAVEFLLDNADINLIKIYRRAFQIAEVIQVYEKMRKNPPLISVSASGEQKS